MTNNNIIIYLYDLITFMEYNLLEDNVYVYIWKAFVHFGRHNIFDSLK
jgi:hypothetical protein